MSGTLATRINQLALAASAVLFVAIGLLWWRDRTRVWEEPRFDAARFARLVAPREAAPRRAFLVAVHLDCSHCRERFAQLAREGAADSSGAALGVLLVDERERPAETALPAALAQAGGGIWWDSLGVWRQAWGRRVYGETFVFAADGQLERVVPTNGDWREAPAH